MRSREWLVLPFSVVLLLCETGSCFQFNREADNAFTRIAFGSCANQSVAQPIWTAIVDFDPQLFIWLGDNIYGDTKLPSQVFGKNSNVGPWKKKPRFLPASSEVMEWKYNAAKNVPGYRELREKAKIVGTWDDHDYGLNDAGKEFHLKETSQKYMLDFLDEPQNSLRRQQEGVYASYTFGPAGKKIKVILLDTRYHRDPLRSNGEILGEAQWSWFDKELRNSDAQVNLIASSIQVLSNFSAMVQPFFHVEAWTNFPEERKRLLKLICDTNVSGVIFMSGDVHFGEINRYDCATSYPLYDITSSGLTQAVEDSVPGFLAFLLRFSAWLMPNTMRVYNSECRYRSCVYGKQNFGTFEIDWDADPVIIKAEVRDVNGKAVLTKRIPLAQLHAGQYGRRPLRTRGVVRHCTPETELPWTRKYLLAISFFSVVSVVVLSQLMLVYYCCKGTLARRLLRKQKRN